MYRPVLKLPQTKAEKIGNYIGGGLFILSILYMIYMWEDLPTNIPMHFDGAGEVDRWGSKWQLLILPAIGLILWVMMALFEKMPHIHNYPERLNEKNVERFYLNSRKLLNEVKNFCLILFAGISVQTIRIAMEKTDSLGWWFLPIVIIGTAIPVIKCLIVSSKIK
ncbi:DUF1648 domain-containing protein [Lysinibacillus piscis]|uniref:DUF1648 domain-containing protein n=1 Tax=Lysinibacillus piscis TaxID=2518931 RepID=A0ABQ5NMI5_9BACI|nr:DUF1648 domain-containing protein [Lysinibacillus sp. KH24]GLC89504.1 hypothetical protein LYSBPC_26310 [Lysinibacillus sp. KH24]